MQRLVSFLLFTALTSCANYTTNTDVDFESTTVPEQDQSILVLQTEIPNAEYEKVGEVEAVVNNRRRSARGPTHDQANFVLRKLAKEEGADAVINVNTNMIFPSSPFGILVSSRPQGSSSSLGRKSNWQKRSR